MSEPPALQGDDLTVAMAAGLRKLAREIYKRHQMSLPIIERLGDVPTIPFGAKFENEIVFDPMNETYDLWIKGDLKSPDLSKDDAISLIREHENA